MASSESPIRIRVSGPEAIVTLQRPGDRNSIDSRMMAALTQALEDLEGGEVRCVIFTGSGPTHFIGGADGVEMMGLSPDEAKAFSARIQALFNRMEESPLMLAAAIDGLCFGGGFEFALACDFRVAAETARIGLPEVKVGIIPGGGGTQRLPRLVGSGPATEMILSGRLYPGPEAHRMGLVHRVCPSDRLLAATRDLLAPVVRRPRHALAGAKRALNAAGRDRFETGLTVERDAFAHCFEQPYFVDLMHRQIADGQLQTTLPVPERHRQRRQESVAVPATGKTHTGTGRNET